MCGITGMFDPGGLEGFHQAIQGANDIIAHRGPDGQGFLLSNPGRGQTGGVWLEQPLPPEHVTADMTLAMGHRRLAILDLSETGRQPMSINGGSHWIVHNGEVYNYLELRSELEALGHHFHSQSDTEVILHAYRQWGERCVDRFNGMWAFAILDMPQKRLFCSRDRFGIKPFFYYADRSDRRRFAFGSEIKQLLCFPFVTRQINDHTVYEFLVHSALDHCEETFFRDIQAMPPGHNLSLDLRDSQLELERYYHPPTQINRTITAAQAAEEFRHLLTDSVRLHLRSDVEVGSCLSGGLDSSSLVCLMHGLLQREGRQDMQRTFSSHFDDRDADELEFMKIVIEATGVQAHFIEPTAEEFAQDVSQMVWHQDEPCGSTSIFAQWSVFKLAHRHGVKVMLDGQGADEQLAGYVPLAKYYVNELKHQRRYPKMLWEAMRAGFFQASLVPGLLPGGRIGNLVRRMAATAPRPVVDWINPDLIQRFSQNGRYVAHSQLQPFGEDEHLNNTLYQLTFHTNLQALLRHEDRDSMAFSVESRVPFLDYRLVEFILSLPSHLKIRNGYTKRVLRDAMDGVIPDRICWRTSKLGFATPERAWQKSVLRPLLAQALEDDRLEAFVLPGKAASYQRQVEAGDLRDSSAWRWINLHLWMDAFKL